MLALFKFVSVFMEELMSLDVSTILNSFLSVSTTAELYNKILQQGYINLPVSTFDHFLCFLKFWIRHGDHYT